MSERCKAPTHVPVKELEKREGVRLMRIVPHESYAIAAKPQIPNDTGPAIVLIVID